MMNNTKKISWIILSIFVFLGAFFIGAREAGAGTCTGVVKCHFEDFEGNCDPEGWYTVGCTGNNSTACFDTANCDTPGNCEISRGCTWDSSGGTGSSVCSYNLSDGSCQGQAPGYACETNKTCNTTGDYDSSGNPKCKCKGGSDGGTGGACGNSSAASCQGKSAGSSCGNDGDGTCANPPNCSCNIPEPPQDLTGCNGTETQCGYAAGFCNYFMEPLTKCGTDPDTDEDLYKVCCGCEATYPAKPTLLYPANGQSVDYSSVPLTWDFNSEWGTGCPVTSNKMKVYVDTINPPRVEKLVAELRGGYRTYNFTGVEGTPVYYWRVEADNGSLGTFSNVRSFNGQSDPWWQLKDADILTNGNLISKVPSSAGTEFILNGLGGFPGVAIYGGTTADFNVGSGTGTVSSTGWLGNASTVSQKTFDYKYFEGLIPQDVIINEITSTSITASDLTAGAQSRGYYWNRFDGTTGSNLNLDLTINGSTNLGANRVILLVKGADLNITNRINLNDGSGFFLTIVGKNDLGGKGDIVVAASAGGAAGVDLEGIYFADSQFKTGSLGEDRDNQLYIRGAVAAYEGMVLERDLTGSNDNDTPAEFFEYGLDQMLLYPPSLSVRKIRWKEVAP